MHEILAATWLTLAAASGTGPIDWVVDEYSKAIALARQRQAPVFVDAWAPW